MHLSTVNSPWYLLILTTFFGVSMDSVTAQPEHNKKSSLSQERKYLLNRLFREGTESNAEQGWKDPFLYSCLKKQLANSNSLIFVCSHFALPGYQHRKGGRHHLSLHTLASCPGCLKAKAGWVNQPPFLFLAERESKGDRIYHSNRNSIFKSLLFFESSSTQKTFNHKSILQQQNGLSEVNKWV